MVAIDGKILRGTLEVGQNQGMHLLVAYLPEEGLVLMQVEVESQELALILRQGYSNVPTARHKFAARPLDTLKLIFQQP